MRRIAFRGEDDIQREDTVWGILENLPDEVRSDITMLVVVTPEEAGNSLANRGFQYPTPSRL